MQCVGRGLIKNHDSRVIEVSECSHDASTALCWNSLFSRMLSLSTGEAVRKA